MWVGGGLSQSQIYYISTYIDFKEGLEQFLRPKSNVQFLSNVIS